MGHEWVPERTPEGAERSGALQAKRRVVRTGSRGTIGRTRELNQLSRLNEAKRNESRVRMRLRHPVGLDPRFTRLLNYYNDDRGLADTLAVIAAMVLGEEVS